MRNIIFAPLVLLLVSAALSAQQKQVGSEPGMQYTPSLDVNSMDKSADPCVDFYQYSCGGWKKTNPIPPDETSW